jgi:hypothetical protein
MTPPYVIANDSERARLNALLDRLSADDLGRCLSNGLTVKEVLVHLAFWDGYAHAALRRWQADGFADSNTDFESVNSSVRTLAGAIPDAAVVEVVRTSAEAVDAEAATVSPELAEVIDGAGKGRTLERALHRRTHVDQIEEVLQR